MFKILIWFSFHLISDEIICKCKKKNFIILEDFRLSSLQSILVKAPKGSGIWPIFPAFDRQTIDSVYVHTGFTEVLDSFWCLTMTRFCEKMFIYNRCILITYLCGFMPNLHKKSWYLLFKSNGLRIIKMCTAVQVWRNDKLIVLLFT